MTRPSTISQTAHAVLTAAAAAANHIVRLPDPVPMAAQRAVAQSMLKAGLVEEVPAADDQSAWRTTVAGERVLLRATPIGLAAVSRADLIADGPARSPEAACGPTVAKPNPVPELASPGHVRGRLRWAAEAVVAAWDDTAGGRPALPAALDALRTALSVTKPHTVRSVQRAPRTGTKQEAVLGLLRRAEGATIVQVAEVTGWASHTVRGFFAGLKKKGISVAVLQRVRQVDPGKVGIKGSYSIYHVAEAG